MQNTSLNMFCSYMYMKILMAMEWFEKKDAFCLQNGLGLPEVVFFQNIHLGINILIYI